MNIIVLILSIAVGLIALLLIIGIFSKKTYTIEREMSLVIDIAFAWYGNRFINKIINNWSVSAYPENWKHVRSKWFSIFHSRQVMNICGFVSLLTGTVFGL